MYTVELTEAVWCVVMSLELTQERSSYLGVRIFARFETKIDFWGQGSFFGIFPNKSFASNIIHFTVLWLTICDLMIINKIEHKFSLSLNYWSESFLVYVSRRTNITADNSSLFKM